MLPTIPSRQYNWVSSNDQKNEEQLKLLEANMKEYYSAQNSESRYYDSSKYFWSSPDFLLHHDILGLLEKGGNLLEVGCGAANVLKTARIDPRNYTGTEFSLPVLNQNKKNFPEAIFQQIHSPYIIDFPDKHFDTVFSHFVLEHTVRPAVFIKESLRVLKPGGMFIIICPGFLDYNILSSQRMGYSDGTAKNKFKKFRIIDSLVSLYDSRFRLPNYCKALKKKNKIKPNFFVNLSPRCFADDYIPDVDAVYAVDQDELMFFISQYTKIIPLDQEQKNACHKLKHVYIKAIKL